MGRRDRDERPPVELWSPVDEPAQVERVELGGARSRGRRGGAVALAAVAALFAAGLLTQGGEEPEAAPSAQEERDNSPRDELKPDAAGRPVTSTTVRRSTTTSTTTTTIPPGPVLGALTGGSTLLLADQGSWTWIDLDTGARGETTIRGIGDPYGIVPVRGGVVVLEVSGQATFRQVTDEVGQALGRADQVVPSGRPDRVWLVHFDTSGNRMVGRLVDLAGDEHLAVAVPGGWIQWGGHPTGLPFTVGGRTYFAGADGVRPLAGGELLGAVPGAVIVQACDDDARCRPHRVDLETGAVTPLGDPSDVQGYFVVPGGAGDIAIVTYGDVSSLSWYAPDGRRLGTVELPLLFHDGFAWLPGDLGLLVPTAGALSRATLDGQGGVVLERIGGLTDATAERLYVINP